MKKILSFEDGPIDKQRSLSMLMTLGAIMADGARAEARQQRERLRRRFAGDDRFSLESAREQASCPAVDHPAASHSSPAGR